MGSLVVFSLDILRVAAFYAAGLGAETLQESSGDIRVMCYREEVLIHSLPTKWAASTETTLPPHSRESASLKPVFDVDSLERALDAVRATGGVVTDRTFRFQGLVRQDVLDPDGNVVQLRCPTS